MTTGIGIGVITIALYLVIAEALRCKYSSLRRINIFSYFWLIMTVLTGLWELTFVLDYNRVISESEFFINNHEHVWTDKYDLSYVLPWKLSPIFYSEYGAWADREYMNRRDDWSRIIESSHAFCCGIFAALAINRMIAKDYVNYAKAMVFSMGTQFMNSILYMNQYYIQMKDPTNVNYVTESFPAGHWLSERPFMWVNICWTVFPLIVLIIDAFFSKPNLKAYVTLKKTYSEFVNY